MKRDLDLVRHILFKVEEKDDPGQWTTASYFVNKQWADEAEIEYHLKLLVEAGYLKGSTRSADNVSTTTITRMTWEGCEFLDTARDDKRWKGAKEIASNAGGVAIDAMKTILSTMAAQAVKSAMGQ